MKKGGLLLSPPEVPDEFWEYPAMRDAFVRRHMGRVIRAFREHPFHGRKIISQGTVAEWIGMTQAQVSRIETGPPIMDLDRLTDWALLLRIPEEYLWFSLPEKDGDVKRSRFLQLGGFTVAHPSFIDFYVAQRVFMDIAVGDSKLLATAQTTHQTDLVLQEFVLRHQSSADFLRECMTKGASAVLRVNSAGILAKLGEPTVTDAVVTNLNADQDSRHLYLTAVSSRVLALEWNQAMQLAARIEQPTSDGLCNLTAAQLALLTSELTNPCDGASRWCSAVL